MPYIEIAAPVPEQKLTDRLENWRAVMLDRKQWKTCDNAEGQYRRERLDAEIEQQRRTPRAVFDIADAWEVQRCVAALLPLWRLWGANS